MLHLPAQAQAVHNQRATVKVSPHRHDGAAVRSLPDASPSAHTDKACAGPPPLKIVRTGDRAAVVSRPKSSTTIVIPATVRGGLPRTRSPVLVEVSSPTRIVIKRLIPVAERRGKSYGRAHGCQSDPCTRTHVACCRPHGCASASPKGFGGGSGHTFCIHSCSKCRREHFWVHNNFPYAQCTA